MEYYDLHKLDESIPSKTEPTCTKHPFHAAPLGPEDEHGVYLLLGNKYSKIYPWMFSERHGHKIQKAEFWWKVHPL